MNKRRVKEWIQQHQDEFRDLALKIWGNPEIAYKEFESASMQKEFLREKGFTIVEKEGLPTAFMAEWGTSGPSFALLGEYDALDGLSQKVSTVREPLVEGAPGHGCGHNLIGVGAMLAACAAKAAFEEQGISACVRYYGCPAEEQLTGKGKMAQRGYFDGADAAFAWHPVDYSSVSEACFTALVSAKFRFKGRSSHAGASPEAGRSALDAVELMNVGANYLREHMIDQNRLHYTITNGGLAPNIVPADAEVWYFLRSPHERELADLWRRLVAVAKGAAMMTETEVSYEILGGCYNTLYNKTLNKVLESNLADFAGAIDYSPEERDFAKKIQETLAPTLVEAAQSRAPLPKDEMLLAKTPLPIFDTGLKVMGSTDVGDVCNIMPTSVMWGVSWPIGVPHHSWQATACTGSTIGLKGMEQAATALAGAIYDLATEDGHKTIESAKNEFKTVRGGRVYCPIEELLTEQ